MRLTHPMKHQMTLYRAVTIPLAVTGPVLSNGCEKLFGGFSMVSGIAPKRTRSPEKETIDTMISLETPSMF